MRSIIIFAIAALVVAGFLPRIAGRIGRAPTDSAVSTEAPAAPSPSLAVPRTAAIPRDFRGHFRVDGKVDGRRIGFMVDTGASYIALTQRDAARLGIHPAPRDYAVRVNTANGIARAAPVNLGMVEIGGVMVRNVAAIVAADEALSENLLGLSFLSRLRRFEYREGRLVLEE